MMKKIRIDFVDFWRDFIKTDNYFYNRLKRYYDVEISDRPDYIFCSSFGAKQYGYEDCVKIHFTGENTVADFNVFDYAIGFPHMSYGDRALRLPLYVLYEEQVQLALRKHEAGKEEFLKRRKFCNRVVSNPDSAPEREEMFRLLSEVHKVDSGGRFCNNIGRPVKDKLAFESRYRFTLAFENSSTPGYTTEKILEAFAGGTVPIYWGDPLIAGEFNPEAFINCMDYPDLPSAVKAVERIAKDEEAYLKMAQAPIVTEGSRAAEYFREDYADDFLRNIFDPPKEEAFRRNREYYGRRYQERMRLAMQVSGVLDIVRKPVHQIGKTFQQIKSRK